MWLFRKKIKDAPASSARVSANEPVPVAPAIPSTPFTVLDSHPFRPDAEVLIYPAHEVQVERGRLCAPCGTPVATAGVCGDGSLRVHALDKGRWCAVAPLGEGIYGYVEFSVK